MSILIKQALLHGKPKDILIQEDRIVKIADKIEESAEHVLDGKNKAIIPSFVNMHTHAAMTLFRSYGDDMELFDWLQNKIWPVEAKLTPEDVYWGTKLACLEMIKSGTLFFNDMYFHPVQGAKAAEEMGLRIATGEIMLDAVLKEQDPEKNKQKIETTMQEIAAFPNAIPALNTHAIYTVNTENLKMIRDLAKEHNWFVHMHLSETEKEVEDCVKAHGKRPVQYLDSIGFLSEKVIAAHSVWFDATEMQLLQKHRVHLVHNPTANMKLAVGKAFQYEALKQHQLNLCLGTDGTGSNNNLDMLEAMKFAALLQKFATNNQTVLSAQEVFAMATENGYKAFGLQGGKIQEGMLADILLIDLKRPAFTPNHNLIANLVYSANGSCVDTAICNGKILMQNRIVEGEEEILEKAAEQAADLFSRS